MKKFFIVLFTFYFSNLFSLDLLDKKTVKIKDKEVAYSLVLETIENIKKLNTQKPSVFYKMVQRCRSNSSQNRGCHKYGCPKGGIVVSRCGLNFHEFDVCRIIIECVKIDGINYTIFNPFDSKPTIDPKDQIDEEEYFV
jgi:hypothetical protein